MRRFDNKKPKTTYLEEQVKKMMKDTDSSSSENELTIKKLKQKIKHLEKGKKHKGEEQPCCSSSLRNKRKVQSTVEDNEPLVVLKKKKVNDNENQFLALICQPQDGKKTFLGEEVRQINCQTQQQSLESLRQPQRHQPPQQSQILQSASQLLHPLPQPLENSELYGEHFQGDTMINIGNNIFCRETIYNMAMVSSCKPTHVARKLIEGVFTLPTILKSTLTGISPRAQGKERQMAKVKALDLIARTTIIDCAIKTGVDRGWAAQEAKVIEKAMSQRLGEIKRLEQQRNQQLPV